MHITEDTREQRPLEFTQPDVVVSRGTVPVFDYALTGDETRFAVERKSLADFVGSVVDRERWGRELRKIERARNLGFKRVVYVIEAAFEDVLTYPYKKIFRGGKVTANFVYRRWRELLYTHGTHTIWAGSDRHAARAVWELLRAREYDLSNNKTEQDEDMSPTTHAPQSPSKLHYLEQCPQYENRSTAAGPAAEEGTKLHAAAETGNLTGLNDEQKHQVQLCIDYTKSLTHKDGLVLREQKLVVGDTGTWGTCDFIHIHGSHMDVVDYKFGHQPVPDAEVNPQGWAYVLGAWALPEARNVETATVHFLLPRRDEITVHKFVRADDAERMTMRVAAIVARAQNPDAPFVPGSACTYCGKKATCPAFHTTALLAPKQAGIAIPEITNPAEVKSPAVLANLLQLAPLIEDWCSQVKATALERARGGEEIPGYTLASRSGRRIIKDVLLAWDVAQRHGVPLRDFLPACSVAVGDLDKAIAANAEKRKGAETIRRVHTELKSLGIEVQDSEIEYLKKDRAS